MRAEAPTLTLVVASVWLLVLTTGVSAADGEGAEAAKGILPVPDYGGDLWNRAYLSGDWGGVRTDLANKGVQLDVDWTQYVQGVVDGGRDRTTRYGGHLDYLIHLDLMRMGLVPGGLVTIRGESRYGHSVNGEAGPILPVNTTAFFPLTDSLDEDVCITVTDLYYTQFLSPQLGVFFGKLNTLDADLNEFASGRGKSQFMHADFLFNSVAALRLPYSTLGVGALWMPSPYVSVKASLVNTLDSSTTTGFEDFGDGLTVTVEADVQYRLGELPGGMNLGGLYSFDQDFTQIGGRLIFTPGSGLVLGNEDKTWAIYWSMWQYLLIEQKTDRPINLSDGVPDLQGLGVFARLGFADQDTNPIEWSGSIGVGGRGIIPSRDHDTFGVGYFYTHFQDTLIGGALGFQNEAQGFEAFYNIAITPAANLTLDVQVQDTALPNVDTAVVVGARLNLRF
jgi:porin